MLGSLLFFIYTIEHVTITVARNRIRSSNFGQIRKYFGWIVGFILCLNLIQAKAETSLEAVDQESNYTVYPSPIPLMMKETPVPTTFLSVITPTMEPTRTPLSNPIVFSDTPSAPTSVDQKSAVGQANADSPKSIPSNNPTHKLQVSSSAPGLPSASYSFSEFGTLVPTSLSSWHGTRESTWIAALGGIPSLFPSSHEQKTSSPSTTIDVAGKHALPASWRQSMLPTWYENIPSAMSPSVSPSIQYSYKPSISHSNKLSISPTVPLQINTLEVTMDIEGSGVLVGRSIITWETITGEHIRRSILSRLSNSPVSDLRTRTNIKKQWNRERPPDTIRIRSLQEPRLKIVFDADFEYRSIGNYNASHWIGQAFESMDNRWSYIQKLQRTGDRAFSRVGNVKVIMNGVMQDQEISTSSNDTNEGNLLNLFIIGGMGIGCLLILVASGILLLRIKAVKIHQSIPTHTSSFDQEMQRINTHIVVRNQDDISTLGEPTCIGGAMMYTVPLDGEDEMIPTIATGDYDFSKHFGVACNIAPYSTSGSSKFLMQSADSSDRDMTTLGDISAASRTDSKISEDASFEKQYKEELTEYEVIVPPGKLGIVIDTPTAGLPVIHAIRNSSILIEKVAVGDSLLVVDGTHTTGMTAMEVSRLISRRADNQARRMVFASPLPQVYIKGNCETFCEKEALHYS